MSRVKRLSYCCIAALTGYAGLAAMQVYAAEPAKHVVTSPASTAARWASRLDGFRLQDAKSPATPGGTLFVGSSSIDFWKTLDADFGSSHPINRGIAGAELSDCVELFSELVAPYAPSRIVLYAGDNDLAAGKSPEQVAAELNSFLAKVSEKLPGTKVAYISIKPSPSRRALLPKIDKSNRLARSLSARYPQMTYIDVYSPMLDPTGAPRADLFRADALHMNEKGYAIWARQLHNFLAPQGSI
jgi:lysophospholipase L1-like esterase